MPPPSLLTVLIEETLQRLLLDPAHDIFIGSRGRDAKSQAGPAARLLGDAANGDRFDKIAGHERGTRDSRRAPVEEFMEKAETLLPELVT